MKTSLVTAFAALAAALTLSLQARASGPQDERGGSSDAKTVVLVHGAFADGSGWNEVIRILQRRGVNVVSVQNPLASLAADSAAVHRAINQQQGLVVLAGHSWGGAVITEAGMNPKVSSLVYVAAFAPDGGESLNDLLRGLPPPPWAAELRQDEGGYLTLSPMGYATYFAQDLPGPQLGVLSATQGPWFAGCLADKVTLAAWRFKPSRWVLPEHDRMIDPRFQLAMATRANAAVTTIAGSHLVMVSHPRKVADVIADAAYALP